MTVIEQAMKEQRKQLPGRTERNRSQLAQILKVRSQVLLALNRPHVQRSDHVSVTVTGVFEPGLRRPD